MVCLYFFLLILYRFFCCFIEFKIWKNWLMFFDLELFEIEFNLVKVVFIKWDIEDKLLGKLILFILWL